MDDSIVGRMNAKRFVTRVILTDAEGALVAPLIPPTRRGGRPRDVDAREVLNAVFYLLSTGCWWNAWPKDLPPKSTVYDYFLLWRSNRTLLRLQQALPCMVRCLDDGRLCMTNNAAERALRGIAVGRNNWTFAGSDAVGRRAAAIYTLIETATLNDVDPQAWLTDVLARLQDHPAKRIAELLPWNWKLQRLKRAA